MSKVNAHIWKEKDIKMRMAWEQKCAMMESKTFGYERDSLK